ncbi:MAG: hypothetical protein ACRCUM_00020 [Mycoplasmoidaceae bacterium]
MNKKLKFSLLGTLITSSALAITFPMISCSSSQPIQLTSDYYLSARRELRLFLLNEFKALNNFEARREHARQLESEEILSDVYSSKIMNNLIFKDNSGKEYSPSEVIDDIFFEFIIIYQRPNGPTNFLTYMQAAIKINFKAGYIAIDNPESAFNDSIVDLGTSTV